MPLPLPDRPGEPSGRVGRPGDDRGRFCGVGEPEPKVLKRFFFVFVFLQLGF